MLYHFKTVAKYPIFISGHFDFGKNSKKNSKKKKKRKKHFPEKKKKITKCWLIVRQHAYIFIAEIKI